MNFLNVIFKNRIFRKFNAVFFIFVIALQLCSCTTLSFVYGNKNDLNLDGYELVFYDEFDGEDINYSLWKTRANGPRSAGFNHPDQVSVSDGNLIITGEYKETEYGEGWHSAMIRLRKKYKYGYFESRCLVNDSEDFFSAFWITTEGVYDHEISQGGVYGAEIDIFETYKDHTLFKKNYVYSSIHCNGKDGDVENIDSKRVVHAYVPKLRLEYTTFGLLWTEEYYIFYVNGQETGRTSFANGTSCVEEDVIFSLTIPSEIHLSKDTKTQFKIDYLKIYQISENK